MFGNARGTADAPKTKQLLKYTDSVLVISQGDNLPLNPSLALFHTLLVQPFHGCSRGACVGPVGLTVWNSAKLSTPLLT